MQNAPKEVREFILNNLFQRNKNHNNQNTAQGIDYKLEEFNKLFKHFEVSSSPSIEEWTKIASAAPKFKEIIEKQSLDYGLNNGLYSEPGAPDYSSRVEKCNQMLKQSEVLKSDNVQMLKNIDGKCLIKKETFGYDKEYEKRKSNYLKSVTANKSFIKAELDFHSTNFLLE